jgi:hypothetical protein
VIALQKRSLATGGKGIKIKAEGCRSLDDTSDQDDSIIESSALMWTQARRSRPDNIALRSIKKEADFARDKSNKSEAAKKLKALQGSRATKQLKTSASELAKTLEEVDFSHFEDNRPFDIWTAGLRQDQYQDLDQIQVQILEEIQGQELDLYQDTRSQNRQYSSEVLDPMDPELRERRYPLRKRRLAQKFVLK